MYSLVYVRVHVCTPSYTSGYMYVPRRIRQGTRKYSVICNWVLNVYRVFYTYRTISSLSDRTSLIVHSDAVIVHIVTYPLSKFVKMYTHGRTRQSTHMYSVVYVTVHMCTQSYTTGYIYVLCRVRVGTYMYSVVYEWVHICTLSYTTGYIYVLCLYE